MKDPGRVKLRMAADAIDSDQAAWWMALRISRGDLRRRWFRRRGSAGTGFSMKGFVEQDWGVLVVMGSSL